MLTALSRTKPKKCSGTARRALKPAGEDDPASKLSDPMCRNMWKKYPPKIHPPSKDPPPTCQMPDVLYQSPFRAVLGAENGPAHYLASGNKVPTD